MKSEFIALAALSVLPVAAMAEKPELVVGIVSDVHMRLQTPGFECYETRFRQSLKFFDREKVDAVVGCGDWMEFGWWQWFHHVGEIWFETFPNNRRSDGEPIEKLFIFGDHEIENFWNPGITRRWPREYIAARDIPIYGRKKVWEETFKEPWAPIMRKRVKGYDFVLAHFTMRETPDHWGQNIPELAEFFKTNTFDRVKPFFYVQHKPPKDTVISPLVSSSDDGTAKRVLKDYPNCVAFCGHKHRASISERSLWQGEFTCLEVPAMQYTCSDPGHENGWCSCEGYVPTDPPQQMKSVTYETGKDGGECYLMRVYRDRIVIERWNVVFMEKLAADWVIPWPNRGEASFEARKAKAKPPAFAAGAKVVATKRLGTDRKGVTNEQYVVTFPVAHSDASHARAYDYRVTAELTRHYWTRTACEKWVYSPKYYLPEARDTNVVTCVFSKAEIPGPFQEVNFKVTPYNAFGQSGPSIESGAIPYRKFGDRHN